MEAIHIPEGHFVFPVCHIELVNAFMVVADAFFRGTYPNDICVVCIEAFDGVLRQAVRVGFAIPQYTDITCSLVDKIDASVGTYPYIAFIVFGQRGYYIVGYPVGIGR
jgi:hypothetical protein